MEGKIRFEDLTREPAMFASMEGARQHGYYWFHNGRQVGTTCYTVEQIKEFINGK